MRKVKWGILSTASIAQRRVIPAMQNCEHAEIHAIASRSLDRAQAVASKLSIPRAYGSYEELFDDPEVEAVYNPLPNHLHVEWSIRAASRGKHVLVEKPLSLNVAEARKLLRARDEYRVKMGEAFMVRTHPQWVRAAELVHSGRIGKLRSAMCYFSYFNVDPANPRNIAEEGGGALMDIGCYPIKTSRFVFGEEPVRVFGCIERDPRFQDGPADLSDPGVSHGPIDLHRFHADGVLPENAILRRRGRVDIEIPFNAPTDKPTRIFDRQR